MVFSVHSQVFYMIQWAEVEDTTTGTQALSSVSWRLISRKTSHSLLEKESAYKEKFVVFVNLKSVSWFKSIFSSVPVYTLSYTGRSGFSLVCESLQWDAWCLLHFCGLTPVCQWDVLNMIFHFCGFVHSGICQHLCRQIKTTVNIFAASSYSAEYPSTSQPPSATRYVFLQMHLANFNFLFSAYSFTSSDAGSFVGSHKSSHCKARDCSCRMCWGKAWTSRSTPTGCQRKYLSFFFHETKKPVLNDSDGNPREVKLTSLHSSSCCNLWRGRDPAACHFRVERWHSTLCLRPSAPFWIGSRADWRYIIFC